MLFLTLSMPIVPLAIGMSAVLLQHGFIIKRTYT